MCFFDNVGTIEKCVSNHYALGNVLDTNLVHKTWRIPADAIELGREFSEKY